MTSGSGQSASSTGLVSCVIGGLPSFWVHRAGADEYRGQAVRSGRGLSQRSADVHVVVGQVVNIRDGPVVADDLEHAVRQADVADVVIGIPDCVDGALAGAHGQPVDRDALDDRIVSEARSFAVEEVDQDGRTRGALDRRPAQEAVSY